MVSGIAGQGDLGTLDGTRLPEIERERAEAALVERENGSSGGEKPHSKLERV